MNLATLALSAAAVLLTSADKAVFDGSLAMAWTCVDLAQDEAERSRLLN